MSKVIPIFLLLVISLSTISCQAQVAIPIDSALVNINSEIDCFVTKNIMLPSYADGIIKYHVTLTLNSDSTVTAVKIEDPFKINCRVCENALSEVLNMGVWPFTLPVDFELPGKIKYLIKIDLINYPLDCP